jgi:hypothetical protein
MASTYEKIATTTLGSANNTITFSSIPNTYTDLRLVFVGATTAANDPYIQFNGVTGSSYSQTSVSGDGASASATSSGGYTTRFSIPGGRQPSANVMWMWELDLFSYTSSTYKTGLFKVSMDKNGSGSVNYAAGLFASSSAVSSISILIPTTTYIAGSTATLYGILKA